MVRLALEAWEPGLGMDGSCPTESASPMEVRVDTEPWLLTEEVPPPPVAVVAAEAAPILRLGVMETPETNKKPVLTNQTCIALRQKSDGLCA